MYKAILGGLFGTVLFASAASAACPVTNTFTTGAVAYASQVNTNFTDLTSCVAPLANPTFTGNVGIGTSPLNALDVAGGIIGDATPSNSVLNGNPTTTHGAFISWGDYWELRQDTSHNFNLDVYNMGGSPFTAFFVSQHGAVGIDTASPSYTLHVNGSVAGTSAYVNLSDERLKKNIVPIRDALSLVTQLQGVRFNWRAPDERTVGKDFNLPVDQPQVGFIAQNVRYILPEAVSVAKGPDAVMSVAESKVVPVLVEALKELKAANDHQSAEIKELQTQVSTLERDVRVRTAQK